MRGFLLLIRKVLGTAVVSLGAVWVGPVGAVLTAISKPLLTKKVELRINFGSANLAHKAKPLLVEVVGIVKCTV